MESKNDSYTVLYVEICNKYDSLLKIEYEQTIQEIIQELIVIFPILV